jgi:hypothetical protein
MKLSQPQSRVEFYTNQLMQQYPNRVIQESELRFEAILSDSKGTYDFPILREDTSGDISLGAASSFERRLSRNNAFQALAISFAIYDVDTTAPVSTLLFNANPNSLAAGGGTAAHVNRLWSKGAISLQVGSITYIDGGLPLRSFYHVGTSQKSDGSTNISSQLL